MPDTAPKSKTKRDLIEAARQVLVEEGYAGLSTRRVAEAGNTQMSQIRYHFGSKEGMILALFEAMNGELVDRQRTLFDNPELSVSQKWSRACDYLEDDLASGYVRVLQELIAAGWSNPAIGRAVADALSQWQRLLEALADDMAVAVGDRMPLPPDQMASLVSSAFIGAEALILLGQDGPERPIKKALRAVGSLIAATETAKG